MNESIKTIIRGIATIIIEECNKNEEFAKKFENILWNNKEEIPNGKINNISREGRSSNRRDPAVLDPIAMIVENESDLVVQLHNLTDKELKDIIAEYGMDSSKLAMKWKDKKRLIDFIVAVSKRRAAKGDAFRS